jgi:hypothetical protein
VAASERANNHRRRRRVTAWRALALLLVATLCACSAQSPLPAPTGSASAPPGQSGSTSAQPSPELSPTPVQESAWDDVVGQISDDGEVSLQTALDAFVLAIGPLPGVAPPAGAGATIPSGTGAVRWLLGHWNELTTEQQAAVDAYFPTPPQTSGTNIIAADARGTPPSVTLADLQQDLSAMRDQVKATIALNLGRDLLTPIQVIITNSTNGRALAATMAVNDHGQKTGLMAACRIYVYPSGQAAVGAERVSMMAHEVFHCFQFSLTTIDAFNAPGTRPWIAEGIPAWVGETIAGGSSNSAGWWAGWLEKPEERALFRRSYDMIGLYSHVARNGYNVWSMLDPLLRAAYDGGNDGAYKALVDATGNKMLDSWGPAYVRQPSLGPAWDFSGPGITANRADVETILLRGPAGGVLRQVPAYTALPLDIDISAEVAVLDAPGAHGLVRFSGSTDQTLATVSGHPLCTVAGGCVCPNGSPGAGTAFADVAAGHAELGAYGHLQGAQIQLSGYTLEAFCQIEEEGLVDPCLVGTWQSAPWTLAGFDKIVPGQQVVDVLAGGDGVRATFTNDAREILDFDGMADLEGTNDQTGLVVSARFDGSSELKVSSDNGELSFIAPVSSTVTMTASADVAGQSFQFLDHVPLAQMSAGSPLATEGSVTYICGATGLQMPLSSRAEAVTWTRVP